MYIVGYKLTEFQYCLAGINANTGNFDILMPLPVHAKNSIVSIGSMYFLQFFFLLLFNYTFILCSFLILY